MVQSLCETLPVARIPELKQQADQYLAQVQANLKYNEFIDIDIAQQLTETTQGLLDAYDNFDDTPIPSPKIA